MVEYPVTPGGMTKNTSPSDAVSHIFHALADTTRRDILSRVAHREMSISEIKKRYGLTFAAIAKHVSVLEKAKLVMKRRSGREQYVSMIPATVTTAEQTLAQYKKMWEARFDNLDQYLTIIHTEGKENE